MSLRVGSTIPPVVGLEFVQGEPVEVKAGNPFVLEFWASWCGPCRSSIPHLTQMQKNFPKVIFIGVNQGEDESSIQNFVNLMGGQMEYRVAADPQMSAYSLFQASGGQGIPHCIAVDKDMKIRFIGHPMQPDLQKVLADMNNEMAAPKVALPLIKETKEELMAMPVKQLQGILGERGLKCGGCIEKVEIVDLIMEKCSNTVYYKK